MQLEWKKYAAAQGQSLEEVERAFLDSAYMSVQSKAAPIMRSPYRVGFEIVHRNDDNTRLVGIFVFRVAKDLYFAPVFFINGSIKGTDLFYRHKTKSFVPLNENWLEYLISLSETSEGVGVPISERINTRRQMNLTSIVNPPAVLANSSNSSYKYASTEDEAQLKKLAHDCWDEIKDLALSELPKESLLKRFIENDGGFSAIRKLASAAKEDPDFAEALHLGSQPENYMPDLEPVKSASAEPNPVLTLHTKVLRNENCKSASAAAIKQGYVIEDSRPKEALNELVYEANTRRVESITQPGVYEVLLSDGSTREMICGYGRRLCCHSHHIDAFGPVLPMVLVETADRKSIDLDSLSQSGQYRVLGHFVSDLKPDLGEARPASGHLYRVLDLHSRSISEPLYVKSVGSNDLNLTKVEVLENPYCSPRTLIINPDYEKTDRVDGVLGKHCVWLPIKSCEDGPEKGKCPDTDIKLGDHYAIEQFIFNHGMAKAAVDRAGENYVVRLNAQERNAQAGVLSKVATKLAIMTHCAVNEETADEILAKADKDHRALFLYTPAETLATKSAHNLRFPQFPEFYDAMNSDFNVLEQPVSRIAVMADRDMPYIEKHRIGDKMSFDAGDNTDNSSLDTKTPQQLYQLSQQRGVGQLFEHGVVGALTNTYDSAALIETYTPDLLTGLDRIGRILFLFYWKPEDFAQAFGSDDQTQLENKLISNFKSFGELVLELLQKNKQGTPGSVSLA